MRILQKAAHWLFITSVKRRLINLNAYESKYQNTASEKLVLRPLHKEYIKIQTQLKQFNSEYVSFNTLTKYLGYKLLHLEQRFNTIQ